MATFCKTSKGGFNVDHIIKWYWSIDNKNLTLSFAQQEKIILYGQEAKRMQAILEDICIFDSTKEKK